MSESISATEWLKQNLEDWDQCEPHWFGELSNLLERYAEYLRTALQESDEKLERLQGWMETKFPPLDVDDSYCNTCSSRSNNPYEHSKSCLWGQARITLSAPTQAPSKKEGK